MANGRGPDYEDKRDVADVQPRKHPAGRITPVLDPNEARQGATHHNVRLVLAISLGVSIVAMAIVYFAFFQTTEPL